MKNLKEEKKENWSLLLEIKKKNNKTGFRSEEQVI